jgi:hypothetical protein
MRPSGNRGSRRRAGAGRKNRAGPSTEGEPGSAELAKKGKYNAAGRRVNGVWCASEAEAVRYEQLLEMEQERIITNLRTQVSFSLNIVTGAKLATYIADFVYNRDSADAREADERIIEEVKGMETPIWKMKKRWFEAQYGERIRVIRRVSGADAWAAEGELGEQMKGKKSSFAEWIKLRYRRQIPE